MNIKIKSKALLTACAVITLSACSQKTDIEYLADAEQHIKSNDTASAIVALKSAAQEYPNNANIRSALGKVFLDVGNAEAAVKEFERATAAKAELKSELTPYFYEAFMLGRLYEETTSFTAKNDISQCSTCQLSQMWTSRVLGDTVKRELNDSASTTELALAEILATENINKDNATKDLLDSIINNTNTSVTERLIASEIALGNGYHQLASQGFTAIFKKRPSTTWLQLPIAQAFVAENKIEEATPFIDGVLAANKNNALGNYLKSITYFKQLDFENAARFGAIALDNNYETPQSRLILGISQLRIGQFERALSNLQSSAASYPREHIAHQMVNLARLELNDSSAVAEDLSTKNELNVLESLLAARTLTALNKDEQDLKSVLNASLSKSKENTPIVEQQTFILDVLQGSVTDKESIEKAREVALGDKTLTNALVSHFIKEGNIDKAIDTLKKFVDKNEADLEILQLMGTLHVLENDYEQADKAFEQASLISENNAPSLYFKLYRNIASGNTSDAVTSASQLLDEHPLHLGGLEALAAIVENSPSYIDVAVKYANNAVESTGSNDTHKLMLANIYTIAGSKELSEKTLDLVEDSNTLKSNSYWSIKHNIARLFGDRNEVKSNFIDWQKAVSNSLESIYSYSNYLIATKNFKDAAEILNTVPDSASGALSVRATEFYAHIQAKQYAKAKSVLQRIESTTPSAPILLFKALLGKAEGKKIEAISAMEQFYRESPNEMNVILLVEFKRSFGESATELLEQHITANPLHYKVMNLLAESYIGVDNKKSETLYKRYLNAFPEDSRVLNNYAWVLLQQKNAESALRSAKKAVSIDAENQSFKDTLAEILLFQAQYNEVIELIKNVQQPAPGLSLKLVEAYFETGEPEKAKALLSQIDSSTLDPSQSKKYEELSKR